MEAGERERDAVREQVPRGQDDARDQAVATSFAFLVAAVVGGSGTVFLAFTLPSLVMTGGRVFFYVL